MRACVLILAGVIAATAARGQEATNPDGPAPPPAAALCTLEGTLVNAANGEPVRRMDVPLFGNHHSYGAETDANGHFLISGIEPDEYYLHSGGGRFPSQTYGQDKSRRRGTMLTLKPGDHVRDVVFRIAPGGVIAGTIYDGDGDPVVGANVVVLRVARPADQGEMQSAGGEQTNDLGQYRIFALTPGRYYVVASARAQAPGPGDPTAPSGVVPLPTFYPGGADWSQASTVEVGIGSEIDGTDITLSEAHGARVRGRAVVEGFGGIPQRNYVSLVARNSRIPSYLFANTGTNTLDDKGNFELRGVPPGSYVLMSYWSKDDATFFGSTPLDVTGADVDGITLTLTRGTRVAGRFRAEHGAALNFGNLSVWLQPADAASTAGGSSQIKPDGTFVVENIYDGTYRLHVGGFPEEFYVKSAQLGGLDILGTDVTISHSQPPGPLEIMLSKDGGRIDGTVLDNQKPVAGAVVALAPNPPNRERDDMYSSKRTDDLGRFSLLGLPPGDYKLFAWPIEEQINWRDPDTLKNYEKSGTPVHVEEKKQQNVQLPLTVPQEEAQ